MADWAGPALPAAWREAVLVDCPLFGWTMDSSAPAAESSLGALAATLTPAASTAAPVASDSVPIWEGSGWKFDGTNDYASVPLNLSALATITVECWFYATAFGATDKLLMEFTANANSNNGAFYLNPNASGSGGFDIAITESGTQNINKFTRPSTSVWHHLAVVMRRATAGTAAATAYIDGVSQSLTSVSGSSPANNFANSTLYVASRAGASLFFGVQIDELFIYAKALSAARVLAHFQAAENPRAVAA